MVLQTCCIANGNSILMETFVLCILMDTLVNEFRQADSAGHKPRHKGNVKEPENSCAYGRRDIEVHHAIGLD
jgi:hypothetical protein